MSSRALCCVAVLVVSAAPGWSCAPRRPPAAARPPEAAGARAATFWLQGRLLVAFGDPPDPGGAPRVRVTLLEVGGTEWTLLLSPELLGGGGAAGWNGRRVRALADTSALPVRTARVLLLRSDEEP